MSERDEDPAREFVAYLHAAATQVTASAMRARAARQRRDRDREHSRRTTGQDARWARRDARSDAEAARRETEHQARMKLNQARLTETLERIRVRQQTRGFADQVGQVREAQHQFDQLVGSFAAAAATRDLSPRHAELARLLAEEVRKHTGIDPDTVIAEAEKRLEQGTGWVDVGHIATAELAEVLVEMQVDADQHDPAQASDTSEGTRIAEHIAVARVGEPPLGPENEPELVDAQVNAEQVLAAQLEAGQQFDAGRGFGL